MCRTFTEWPTTDTRTHTYTHTYTHTHTAGKALPKLMRQWYNRIEACTMKCPMVHSPNCTTAIDNTQHHYWNRNTKYWQMCILHICENLVWPTGPFV